MEATQTRLQILNVFETPCIKRSAFRLYQDLTLQKKKAALSIDKDYSTQIRYPLAIVIHENDKFTVIVHMGLEICGLSTMTMK